MSKDAPISNRKLDHIQINLEKDVRSGLSTGLEDIFFIHEALPEINLNQIITKSQLFNKTLTAPILISSMTGGTREATSINQRLAEAAQETGIAMGVGSQRAALEIPELKPSFSIVRKVAPDILLFANLGAIQLNNGFGIIECQQAVEMISADALILHLNPLQEAVQIDGNTNFDGLANKIEGVCSKVGVPVIVKEVGWGISEKTAQILRDCGVSAIDVAGAGGTSWTQVEMHRASNDFTRNLASSFRDWGIPTADSIRLVKAAVDDLPIFASGGLRDGLDIAKCVALGACLGGLAGPFLKPASISTEKVIQTIQLIQHQIRVTMFSTGAVDLRHLSNERLTIRKRY